MSILSDEVIKRIQQIDALIGRLEHRGAKLPEGHVRVSTNKGKHRYYHITEGGIPGGKYLKQSETELARRLIQKEYEKQVLKSLYAEHAVLVKMQEIYGSETGHFFYGPEERIRQGLNEGRKRLVNPVEEDDESFIEEWLSEEFERKPFAENAPEYYTGSGIRVRSKTELIIAEMLEKKEIPFYYEKPLVLDGFGIIHPDFTVLNTEKRKTMYWEHMGMMDDADYRNRALERICRYESAGFVPGINLIITMESSYRPVKTRNIEKMIDAYLL